MKYLDWNFCIASHFFNKVNSGKDVYLYITKNDIISIGKPNLKGIEEEEVWQDFLNAIKFGIPGSVDCVTIVDKAVYSYKLWKRPGLKSIQSSTLQYPFYVAYLVFFILPLTEDNSEFHSRNYYGRLKAFLNINNIKQKIDKLNAFENLWSDLEDWSIIAKDGNLGMFSLGNFSKNYLYVGKPYSQCIFSQSSIKKLPNLFSKAGLIPNLICSLDEIKSILIKYGVSILGFKTGIVNVIKKSQSDELGKSILKIAHREYLKWNGEINELVNSNVSERVTKNFTYSRIFLQLKPNEDNCEIAFSYRMYSSNIYPEDLKLGEFTNLYQTGGWSRTLSIPFKESFSLEDNLNKWIAKYPSQDIRLFMNGSSYDFSSSFWIETNCLIKTSWMFLLCKNNFVDKIAEWGNHFLKGHFLSVDFKGIPYGYFLFKFLNPSESHQEIQILQFSSTKTIKLNEALQVDHRTYTDDFLPEISVINGDGTESPYLEFKDNGERMILKKKNSVNDLWILPAKITDRDFYVNLEGEKLSAYNKSYRIVTSDRSAILVKGDKLARRDCFGKSTTIELEQYCLGSNVINPGKASQRSYSPWETLFASPKENLPEDIYISDYIHHPGNILLSFLTFKSCSKSIDFYNAFELLYNRQFSEGFRDESINYSKIKKTSLNFYDYLGFLDYDYENDRIVVNQPQLIFIPAEYGRKVLLIGARDRALVNEIVAKAPTFNLQVDISPQLLENRHLLLPDAITIKAYGTSKELYGEHNLIAFANELGIDFNSKDLLQLSLQHFSADIHAFEIDMIANHELNDMNWDFAPYVFNYETLNFDRVENKDLSKKCLLCEYRVRPWQYYHLLWLDNKCYKVDKNWGRFLILKYKQKQNVILFDGLNEKVAIPFQLPLPRILAESIMILSGLAPAFKRINEINYRVYSNIPGIFAENLFQKLAQYPKPTHL